jgi:hypothetical protein
VGVVLGDWREGRSSSANQKDAGGGTFDPRPYGTGPWSISRNADAAVGLLFSVFFAVYFSAQYPGRTRITA